MFLRIGVHKKSVCFTLRRRLAPPSHAPRVASRPLSSLTIPPAPGHHNSTITEQFSTRIPEAPITDEYDSRKPSEWVNVVQEDDAWPVALETTYRTVDPGRPSKNEKTAQPSSTGRFQIRAVRPREVKWAVYANNLTRSGLSEAQYRRWKVVVQKSQQNKGHKAKRQDELNDLATSVSRQDSAAEWDKCFKHMEEGAMTSDHERPLIQFEYEGPPRRPVVQTRADGIPQPSSWSVVNFKNYVEDLARSMMSPLRQRKLYHGVEPHQVAVAEELGLLFGRSHLEKHWSVDACNIALRFYYNHSMQHRARRLYSQMEDRKYLTSTETFNIMLRGSARRKNVAQFRGLVDAMIKRNLKPDAETWEAFFVVSESSNQKSEIFQTMRDQGAFDDLGRMSSFLTLNIRQIFRRQLDRGHKVAWLLEYMDKLEDFQWLSTSVGNILIDEIGKTSSVEEALDLFDQLEARGMKTDHVTLNTLIHKCVPLRNHDNVVYALRRLADHDIHPDSVAYTALFSAVWRCKAYNAAKVVWRYACVEGQTTSDMCNIVSQNIKHELNGPPEQPSRKSVWAAFAGRVVVGVELGLLKGLGQHSMPAITEITGSQLMKRDLNSAHHYAFERKLHDLLEEALAMDRQWTNEYVWRNKGLDWMLEYSIDVRQAHTFPLRFLGPEES